jgi:hypothetical protein
MRSVRGFGPGPRSNTGTLKEPLPGISPLDVRVGLRLKPCLERTCTKPDWGLECTVRMVDTQKRAASSLYEFATPSFNTVALRAFWQATPRLMLIGGAENLGDVFYREHIDLRTGIGTYRPGVSGYFGTEWTY